MRCKNKHRRKAKKKEKNDPDEGGWSRNVETEAKAELDPWDKSVIKVLLPF